MSKTRKSRSSTRSSNRSRTPAATVRAAGSPARYRVRVRMYRHGLGDCFLLTFSRPNGVPFHALIDCGALGRDKGAMTKVVEHVRDTVLDGKAQGKARLDLVVATHEHKDHVSGFNQAREVFDRDFDIGAVWLGWPENLTLPQIKKLKESRRKVAGRLRETLTMGMALDNAGVRGALRGVESLLSFTADDGAAPAGRRTIADALEYLKQRGGKRLEFLEPGTEPIPLDGVAGVRVFVLGPPHDPAYLKESAVTKQMKDTDIIYHLSQPGMTGADGYTAALSALTGTQVEKRHPFSEEHRIASGFRWYLGEAHAERNPYFAAIEPFVAETYGKPKERWRKIDDDWLRAVDQLAIDLDNDTNNTSVVLAFEFTDTHEVLLFVGDAQVGSWRSWASVSFKVPERENALPALDLLGRAVFYKVGHHCSHNATLKKGGLELMARDSLVAFIPVDRETAKKQGKKDEGSETGKTGWDMPAGPLFKALQQKAAGRVVLSDVTADLPREAKQAGVVSTDTYVDYFLM